MKIMNFYVNELNFGFRCLLFLKQKSCLKLDICILMVFSILSFPNTVISSDLNHLVNSNYVFPENKDIFEPKLRPINLSIGNETLIINTKVDLSLPPKKPENFNTIVSKINKPQIDYDTISLRTFNISDQNDVYIELKKDDHKINFMNKFNTSEYKLITTFGSQKQKAALFKKANGSYHSSKVNQRINGWEILEINLKSIKVQKGLQSEIVKISD